MNGILTCHMIKCYEHEYRSIDELTDNSAHIVSYPEMTILCDFLYEGEGENIYMLGNEKRDKTCCCHTHTRTKNYCI